MRVYDKYVKARQKAIGVFTRARDDLKNLHHLLLAEHADCAEVIKDQVARQQFLENEAVQVHNHIQAINHVIGDQQ